VLMFTCTVVPNRTGPDTGKASLGSGVYCTTSASFTDSSQHQLGLS
jgi:hypothetical protein